MPTSNTVNVICRALADAVDVGEVSHAAIAERIIDALTAAHLLVGPNGVPSPPTLIEPLLSSVVPDTVAVARSVHYALEAERALECSGTDDGHVLAGSINVSKAQAAADLAAAWAFIAITFQGPVTETETLSESANGDGHG